MATIIEMPKLSDTMVTGKLLSWIKKEGDPIEAGEAIAEVETDKATMELEVFEDGTLLKILAQKEDEIPVGGPLAIVGESGEDVTALVEQANAQAKAAVSKTEDTPPSTTESPQESPAPVAATAAASQPPAESAPTKTPNGRLKISPVAQRIAAEHNIDVRTVQGTGPGGRIVKKDIEALLAGGFSVTPPAPPAAYSGSPYEDIPLTSVRATIASRLPQSLGPVPHFYLETDIHAAPLLEASRQLKNFSDDVRITITDLLIKACAIALQKHPQVNSQFNGTSVRRFNTVNVGLAVAGDGHLLVPVIKNCESKTASQIAADRADVVARGQQGRLTLDEMTGGTFTISNLGMYGITRFEAIINPPEAAILAVGTIRDEPVVQGDQVVPGKRMALTLSCDHRVFDGAEGAQFMATLQKLLENPIALCL